VLVEPLLGVAAAGAEALADEAPADEAWFAPKPAAPPPEFQGRYAPGGGADSKVDCPTTGMGPGLPPFVPGFVPVWPLQATNASAEGSKAK
jgi:hypothetical protein